MTNEQAMMRRGRLVNVPGNRVGRLGGIEKTQLGEMFRVSFENDPDGFFFAEDLRRV